jgi:signal transduction histidine kinase
MAGDARAQACLTKGAEPCVSLPEAQDDAMNESGCTSGATSSLRPKELKQTGDVEALATAMAHDFNNLLATITTYTLLVLEELKPDDPSRPDLEEVCRAAQRARELTRDLCGLGQRRSSVLLSS